MSVLVFISWVKHTEMYKTGSVLYVQADLRSIAGSWCKLPDGSTYWRHKVGIKVHVKISSSLFVHLNWSGLTYSNSLPDIFILCRIGSRDAYTWQIWKDELLDWMLCTQIKRIEYRDRVNRGKPVGTSEITVILNGSIKELFL